MAPLSLKIILDDGAVTRKVKFDTKTTVREAHSIVKEKVILSDPTKEYALFLRSADNNLAGIWLEHHRTLDYYMLRDGDSLDYICKIRNLRVKLLDGSLKTLQVDEEKTVSQLMEDICSRLGIINHDEYGLSPEEESLLEDKKNKQPEERDVAFETLSRTLHTDDNVVWLDQHRTLREQRIETNATVILKRRLFYSDRNVDSRDPIQLNLLYVQTRDAILSGHHLVTEEQAVEFGGIQCQIQFGDYQEDKHKPGFIENLSEFLPATYIGSWGIEKKVYKAHRKHHGLAPLEAKNTYIKTARELPTYGVTFFLVKEKQKGKRKLVPRLLGINSEAILRLDENTKEIIQQWPLTHVKTYHVGKSDTFTLKFGDWSDKEYSCKTQDVLRIRDILVGYIDLIQRRMFAKPYGDSGDSMAICHDNVQTGTSNVIQHVSYQASKPLKETFVGPSVLVPHQQGSTAQQGAHVTTVHQIIQSHQMNNPQNAKSGEVAVRSGEVSLNCLRKLKRMNSNSVKIVTLLTEPTEEHVKNVQDIVNNMKQDLAVIEMGLQESAQQQSIEESKRMLLDEMQDLMRYMNQLAGYTVPGHVDPSEAKDAAEKIADLTTEMCFAQDKKTRRRSAILNSSRKSLKAGEEMEANIRRASLIAAGTSALAGIDNATLYIAQEYSGPVVNAATARRLEDSLRDEIGRLNAALALYLTAHSDPNNIDYPAAINSMHTINELMKTLPADAQMLASTKDPAVRKELQDDLRTLLDGARKLCSLTEKNEHEKMQDACNQYADVANKLIFTFARGKNVDKENEIIELSRDVGAKASLLLLSTNQLLGEDSIDPEAATAVDQAGVRSAAAARDLLACAQLTAPAIHEPHCQSAMSAACEGLTSSLHKLSNTWQPLVVDPSKVQLGDHLHQREMNVHKALEKLQDAYSNISGPDDVSLPLQEKQRLKFMCSLAGAKNALERLQYKWDKPVGASAGDKSEEEAARHRLAQQLGQLNAAVAALSRATRDQNNQDYATAELALNTISQLTPQIVKDMELLSSSQDEGTRNAMQHHVIGLCEASKDMFHNVQNLDGLGKSAAKFSAASSKLTFLVSPGADKGREKMIEKIAAEVYDNASALASNIHPLQKKVDPETATYLDNQGTRIDSAARGLVTVAQITAPSISDSRCATALSSAVEELRESSNELTSVCLPHVDSGSVEHEQLHDCLQNLHKNLDYLVHLGQLDRIGDDSTQLPQQEKKRLQFINTIANAKCRLDTADQLLKEPPICSMMREEDAAALQHQLSDRMAQLNAAIAALTRATHGENPDYMAAERSANAIAELMPQIVKDTRVLCGTKDGDTQSRMLQQVQHLCDASRNICDNVGQPQSFNEAAAKFGNASRNLVYCLSPKCDMNKEKQITALSAVAHDQASELNTAAKKLAQRLPKDVGSLLETRGDATEAASQHLLTTTKVTAPTITSPQCSTELISSAEHLRNSANELTSACRPHITHGNKEDNRVQTCQQELEKTLDKLVQACQLSSDNTPGLSRDQQDRQRLQFINSLSGAKSCFYDAHQKLQQPVICSLMTESDGQVLQHQLSDRLAQLNAAIAALAVATTDRENPDYASAQQAVNTITNLLPLVVKDTRVLCGTKDDDTQSRMLQQVQHLCDASRNICDNVGQPQDLRDATARFADASSKLMFTMTPKGQQKRSQQIIDLSAMSCGRTSELLSQVQALTQQVGGDVATDLDMRGANTADAAQNLLAVAQVTASSMSSPQCRTALESAVEKLRGSAAQLTAASVPHTQPAKQNLTDTHQQLNDSLDTLLQVCKETQDGAPDVSPQEQREKQRLQFINSLSKANTCFDDTHQKLKQPLVCSLMAESDGQVLQHQLSDRLAQLNAAIASLAVATADRDHPDYASAQQAVNTITDLMPLLVKDTRVLCGTKDGDTQSRMLQQVQQLCDASRNICDNVGQPQELRDSAAKFSDASSKLMFTITPGNHQGKMQQIIDLSAMSCGRTSELLSQVQALTQQVGGDVATDLDMRGANTADAAQNLLAVAQVTAPSMSSPQCRTTLESAVEKLRGSAAQLTAACVPHTQPAAKQNLTDTHQQLNNSLDTLLQVCREVQSGVPGVSSQREKQRLQFINSLSKVNTCFDDTHQKLKQPVVRSLMTESEQQVLQHQLSDRLAQLNAAIAALAVATADRDHPDYARAQRSINTINNLMPLLVKDTRVLCGTKDGDTQSRMLQQVQQLCDASRNICDNVGQPQELRDAAAKFSVASSNLMFTIKPEGQHGKSQQIIDLSAMSCGRTSELLSQAQALTQQVGGDVATDLDMRGANTADAAQNLLAVAQVTAPSMDSLQCRSALESAVEKLRGSAAQLTAASVPHAQPAAKQNLTDTHQQLNYSLDTLLQVCKEAQNGAPDVLSPEERKKQRLQFVNSLSKASSSFDDAHKRLLQRPGRELLRQEDGAVLEYQLFERVAQLNAAIAALTHSMHDRDHPDYPSAQRAVSTITALMPLLVKDAKSLGSIKDENNRKKILYQVQKLCDASKVLCEKAGDSQALGPVSATFGNVSAELMSSISPRSDREKENTIVDLSKKSCEGTCNLLSQVQTLTQQVGGEVAADLDARRTKCTDSAQALHNIAQVTSASIASPHCQAELERAVETLRRSADNLTNVCTRYVAPGARQLHLQRSQEQLEDDLDTLLDASRNTQLGFSAGWTEPAPLQIQRVKFISNVSEVSIQLDDAEKHVQESIVCTSVMTQNSEALKHQLTRRLALLNTAIAALTSATTDHHNPDYPTAERSIITITELMPTVIQEAKKMSCSKDDNCKEKIHQNVKTLYEASRSICDNAGDPKKLNTAALSFAVTSGELLSLVGFEDHAQPVTTLSSNKAQKPAPPVRSTKTMVRAVPLSHTAATGDFLDTLRAEATRDHISQVLDLDGKDSQKHCVDEDVEKLSYEEFSTAVDTAEDELKYAENSLKELNTKHINTAHIDPLEVVRKEQNMEEILGKAGMEVAALVTANYDNKLDYKAAKEPIVALTRAVTNAVEDGCAISSTLQEETRKKFVSDMMSLCQATKNICEASRKDNKKLNDSAIIFANQSTKLLRVVSPDMNTALEREVISRARAIGDSASRLALEATAVANSTTNNSSSTDSSRSQAQAICTAGAQCLDAAGKLVYTAKLIAPTFHHATCQETLVSSVDTLSSNLAKFSETWKPLPPDEHTEKLTQEANNLKTLLENLKADVKNEKLGSKRLKQQTIVLDTPLRQLSCQIIENAKNIAEHGELPAEEKQEYQKYCNKLTEALRALDLANARCQRAPHNKKRRYEMAAVIGDLEVLALQSRPTRVGQEPNNIVDFRDFLEAMVKESTQLAKVSDKYQGVAGKRLIDDIKVLCTKINEDVPKLTNPTHHVDYDTFDDIMEIEKFAEECDLLVKELHSKIRNVADQKARVALQTKLLPVIENLNLLRFATNSAQSNAHSATYDAVLQDLENFESTVFKAIVKHANKSKGTKKKVRHPVAHSHTGPLLKATLYKHETLEKEMTKYSVLALADASERPYLENVIESIHGVYENVKNMVQPRHLLVANGIPCDEDNSGLEASEVVLEVRRYSSAMTPKTQLLKKEHTDKLMYRKNQDSLATRSQLEEQFNQVATKVNTLSGKIIQNIKKPDLASQNLKSLNESVVQLASIARGLKTKSKPIQSKKIEHATHEMTVATLNLIDTTEILCQDPSHYVTRGKLTTAIHQLNDAINKLDRAIHHHEPNISRECNEHLRSLQLYSSSLKSAPQPVTASPYSHCLDALQSQRDILLKLNSDQQMSREEFLQSMMFTTAAVGNCTELAAQATYLLSVSEKDQSIPQEGIVDVQKIQKGIAAIHDSCVSIIRNPTEQVIEEKKIMENMIEELLKDLDDTIQKAKDQDAKKDLMECRKDVDLSAKALYKAINENKPAEEITDLTLTLANEVHYLDGVLHHPALVPTADQVSDDTQAHYDDVVKHSTDLVLKTEELMKEIKLSPNHSQLNWSSYTKKREVLAAFEALIKSIKENGHKSNILEAEPEESEEKSYVQIQSAAAYKWLHKPMAKSDIKLNGQQATRNLIDVGKKMTEELSGTDKEDMRHLIEETQQLFNQCCKRYDQEQYSLLMERIRELHKAIERMAVTRVVEDFMQAEEPLADLDILADVEKDEKKRKFMLERKIAELLAQLANVTKTARFIADTGNGGRTISNKLKTCSEQSELLAPMLVKAAEERIHRPDDKAAIEKYQALLAEYAESLSKVRDLCDQSVDPMEFVQAASETMQRMREESTKHNDPMKCAYTSAAITKLANRVINVSLSSSSARKDPELQQALTRAQQQLSAATPAPDLRASRIPDWKDTTAQILRTTEEVEQVLGGENIFNQQPQDDQPIYNEARNLHEVTRGWSARDNEIVAVAKRMAVLMAKLSSYMNTNNQRDVLTTSNAIVAESREVARLAKKLAHECSDHRIKTNLLQLCEKIPTISAQLKMLTTVKGSSLGNQDTREDQEAMDMLVGNAQSLMISTRDVVNAANSASVKIMSQRGPRIKWVRKTYY